MSISFHSRIKIFSFMFTLSKTIVCKPEYFIVLVIFLRYNIVIYDTSIILFNRIDIKIEERVNIVNFFIKRMTY